MLTWLVRNECDLKQDRWIPDFIVLIQKLFLPKVRSNSGRNTHLDCTG